MIRDYTQYIIIKKSNYPLFQIKVQDIDKKKPLLETLDFNLTKPSLPSNLDLVKTKKKLRPSPTIRGNTPPTHSNIGLKTKLRKTQTSDKRVFFQCCTFSAIVLLILTILSFFAHLMTELKSIQEQLTSTNDSYLLISYFINSRLKNQSQTIEMMRNKISKLEIKPEFNINQIIISRETEIEIEPKPKETDQLPVEKPSDSKIFIQNDNQPETELNEPNEMSSLFSHSYPISLVLSSLWLLIIILKKAKNIPKSILKSKNRRNDKYKDSLKVNYWNVQYLNRADYGKYCIKKHILLQNDPDILMLNETNIIPDFKNFTTYYSEATTPNRGKKVNVAILVKDDLTAEDPKFEADENLVYVKVLTGNGYIHLICLYGDNNIVTKNATQNKIILILNKIFNSESNPKVLMAGDFNINHNHNHPAKNKAFKTFLNQLEYVKLNSYTCLRRNRNRNRNWLRSRIDHAFCNNLSADVSKLKRSWLHQVSDHVGFEIRIAGKFSTSRIISKFPNRNTFKKIVEEILNFRRPSISVIPKLLKKHKNKLMSYRKVYVRLSKRIKDIINNNENVETAAKLIKDSFENLISSVGSLRFSKDSKQAFSLLKNVYQYQNFEKAGGSIIRRKQLHPKFGHIKQENYSTL